MTLTGQKQTIPRLPLELVEVIIDFLHSQKDVLATCSVVSRHWLPAARYYLSGEIDVVDYMGVSPKPVLKAQTFIRFMLPPQNPFLTYIHGATITTDMYLADVMQVLLTIS
ncbi:hypothetical protein QCA50_016624 [Cerrena zonata]|uniref:F-box domain-containing protein n=1 Tax=Cerrena zonata TaxID=2478898 RepID=A0AAW0FLE3_9APHY